MGDFNSVHEVVTPELTLPWTEISAQLGAYVDGDRLSVGISETACYDEWTFEFMKQVGVYSTAQIISASYTPNDKLLPSVTVSLDTEINHLVRVGAAAAAVVVVYFPEVIAATAPALKEFLTDVGTYTPAFNQ